MIYDLFMYNGEADMLEIRLNILDPYVDCFVIGESRQTFSGKPKPLYLYHELLPPDRFGKFDKWAKKIRYVFIPEMETDNVFERTAFQKDYLRTALKDCKPDDVIYYGDVDEIWKPQTQEGKLRQLNYSYFLNNRSSEDWQGTNVFKYANIRDLNEVRADHTNILDDGGWHFTNCGDANFIRNKLDSYDHQEYATDEIKSKVEQRIANGEDYVGRTRDWQGFPFEFWVSEVGLPQYLKENKHLYKHLWK